MKKLSFVIVTMLLFCSTIYAQSSKEIEKRVRKEAKKEAKKLTKEGWQVSPGALPLELQLEEAYRMMFEKDEYGYPKYIWGSEQSIAQTYEAAKTAAKSAALYDLAGSIQYEVSALIENTVENEALAPEEAESITETIMGSKAFISQSIGRTILAVECHRTLKNKNKEVQIRIFYNAELAKRAASKAVREELEKKGEKLHEQLDKILGL